MEKKFKTVLSTAFVPNVLELIMTELKINELEAVSIFYSSKTYELLSNESTKLWHYSPKTLSIMFLHEYKHCEIIFPED